MTKQSTKSEASVLAELKAQAAELNARIAALMGESHAISVAVVRRFTIGNWDALRWAMVAGGKEGKKLSKTHNGYELVKAAKLSDYLAVKGFYTTLRSLEERQRNGEDVAVELYSNVNPKTGKSQVSHAQETIASLIETGFIDPTSPIIVGEPKARKSAKRS